MPQNPSQVLNEADIKVPPEASTPRKEEPATTDVKKDEYEVQKPEVNRDSN